MVSHVLLTPLSAAVMWCERLLAAGELPEVAERGLVAIDRSARTQAAILDNLVELSFLQAGATDLHRAAVDLEDCVRDVLVRSASAARQHGVTIRVERGGERVSVAGDPIRLRTALFNLVDNAVKVSPRGGVVTLAVTTTPRDVAIRVSDEGPGLSPAAFGAAVPVAVDLSARSISARRGGLGLGLLVARRIAELHGGTLALDAPGAGGASLSLTLPRA